MLTAVPGQLTGDQRRIVEWGDGPLVVIAGAGTGKTRVIVERVRWLLETRGAAAQTDDPLLPEHLLVMTYNVKAAKKLQTRLNQVVGVAARSRMTVTNFHSFCQRILTENAADAGLPPHPDVLDGIGQVLLLKDIRPQLHLVYHSDWWLGGFVQFISRAKDELVTPDDFDAYVDEERRIFEARYGSFEAAAARLESQGNLASRSATFAPPTPGSETTSARRPAAKPRTTSRTPRRGSPTARPAARSPAPATRRRAAGSRRTSTSRSTPFARPTSSTAPPSKSSG